MTWIETRRHSGFVSQRIVGQQPLESPIGQEKTRSPKESGFVFFKNQAERRFRRNSRFGLNIQVKGASESEV